MRLFRSLCLLLLALPAGAVEVERPAGAPETPVVRELPALPPALSAPSALVLSEATNDVSPALPETPLVARLGLKNDSPLAPALAPVSNALASPGAGRAEADADWNARLGEHRPLSIVLAAAEAVPLIKTGGLADVIDALGRGFSARGHDVTLFLPKHKVLKTGGIGFKKLDAALDVPVAGKLEKATLWEGRHEGLRVVLVDHEHFFDRDAPYGGYYGDFPDSDERFIFFSRAVLEASKALSLKPDVIHAHDWHAALTAPMLKLLYAGDPAFVATKAVITLHNMAFQGNFPPKTLSKAGFGPEHFTVDALEHQGRFNFLHGGLRYADAVTTVSPTYAREIQDDPKFGAGLETALKARSSDLHGIINGVDPKLWDPDADDVLSRGYGVEDAAVGKAVAKRDLQGMAGLDNDPAAPIFAVASRLAHQKGLDLVAQAAPKLIALGAQLVITGSGDGELEKAFAELAAAHPGRVFLHPFDEYFVRRVFAAADFLLMPSRFEPCGLSQLIAQRYGTLPIVTRTGGLVDTVTDVRDDPARGDGLFLSEFSPEALTQAALAAIAHLRDPAALARSRRAAMTKDSSWDGPIEAYLELFYRLRRSKQ